MFSEFNANLKVGPLLVNDISFTKVYECGGIYIYIIESTGDSTFNQAFNPINLFFRVLSIVFGIDLKMITLNEYGPFKTLLNSCSKYDCR